MWLTNVLIDILTYEFEGTLTAAGRAARARLESLPSFGRPEETLAERIDRYRPNGWRAPPPS
jgi:hypothetical protein